MNIILMTLVIYYQTVQCVLCVFPLLMEFFVLPSSHPIHMIEVYLNTEKFSVKHRIVLTFGKYLTFGKTYCSLKKSLASRE